MHAHIGGDIDFAMTLFPEAHDHDDEPIVLEEKHRCSSHLASVKGMLALGKYTDVDAQTHTDTSKSTQNTQASSRRMWGSWWLSGTIVSRGCAAKI